VTLLCFVKHISAQPAPGGAKVLKAKEFPAYFPRQTAGHAAAGGCCIRRDTRLRVSRFQNFCRTDYSEKKRAARKKRKKSGAASGE
jgi:hypothetical protein